MYFFRRRVEKEKRRSTEKAKRDGRMIRSQLIGTIGPVCVPASNGRRLTAGLRTRKARVNWKKRRPVARLARNKERDNTVHKTHGGGAEGGNLSFYGWLPIVPYNTFTLRPIIISYSECIVFLGRDNVSSTRQASTQSVTLSFPLSLALFRFRFFFLLFSSCRFRQRSISYQGS